jgi:hypothetical protein
LEFGTDDIIQYLGTADHGAGPPTLPYRENFEDNNLPPIPGIVVVVLTLVWLFSTLH